MIRVKGRTIITVSLTLAVGLMLLALALNHRAAAQAALFSDNFEDGNSTGWTTSGGSWSVVSDGTRVFKQAGTSGDARARAGVASWSNYAVQARVKPLSFNGADRFIALVARAQSNTSYYYLALRSSNQLELRKLVSGSATTLASKSFTVTTGAWYTLKIEATGSSLKAYVNDMLQLSATDSQFASGNVGSTTFNASAEFDDFVVTSTSGAATPTPTATPTSTPLPTPTPAATPTPTTGGPVVFPGAEGFGVETPAGRGGQIIKVTNLNASGAGSLRAALNTPGPRIIVFEVGGIIDLNRTRLDITEPFVTIAGQTAPSPGITLIKGGMSITTHDVLIKHLRFRMGDADVTSGFEPDVTTSGPSAYNIVIDHCSFAWAVDENMSVSGPRLNGPNGTSRRVTLSHNIIAEALHDSIHSKGVHSMGTLIHDYCTDVAVIGNFYAHNHDRNPWFKAFATGVIVNNLIYNPVKRAIKLGAVPTEWSGSGITPENPRVSIVGNYMKYGDDTPSGLQLVSAASSGDAYLSDNIALDKTGASVALTSSNINQLNARPSWPARGLTVLAANQVINQITTHAGARPRDRDSVDRRLIADFLAGRGRLINSQNEVGGYPTATMTVRPLNVPSGNIDAWLHSFSLELE